MIEFITDYCSRMIRATILSYAIRYSSGTYIWVVTTYVMKYIESIYDVSEVSKRTRRYYTVTMGGDLGREEGP